MTKFRMGRITQVNSLQSVQIDGMLCHMKDLRSFMGSKPSSGHDSDLEKRDQLVNLGSTALGERDDSPDDGSSEDRMTLQDHSPNTSGQNAENPTSIMKSTNPKNPPWLMKYPKISLNLNKHTKNNSNLSNYMEEIHNILLTYPNHKHIYTDGSKRFTRVECSAILNNIAIQKRKNHSHLFGLRHYKI